MNNKKKSYNPQAFQKKFAAVMAIVLCAALVLSIVAGVLAY